MSAVELPEGYRNIPEADRKKAGVFFERAAAVAGTGNFDYAIEMYISGLSIDPENVEAHQALRDIALKRKAGGGKDMGMLAKMKVKREGKDPKSKMLVSEKLLGYDPGNTDHMLSLMSNAFEAGCYDTCLWIGPILHRANADDRNPSASKFIQLKNIYKDLKQWKPAINAGQAALMLQPEDMALNQEIKDLAAMDTMEKGRYGTAGSFRQSMKDVDSQQKLMDANRDVRSVHVLDRMIAEAEAEWQANPHEVGKLMKLVEALIRTEEKQHEDRAIQLLTDAYEKTKQFRFRHNVGRIRLMQLAREDRTRRAAFEADPQNQELRQEYQQFHRARLEEELSEYLLFSENYPTDQTFRYQAAIRLFLLGRYNDAIPVFQHARSDPKFRHEAAIYLGRAFLEMNFVDEAADTLRAGIEEYQLKGDDRSKLMYYWYARALERKGDAEAAAKAYSQVAQWDFNYLDVQARLKRVREAASGQVGESAG